MSPRHQAPLHNKALGMLLLGAVGDALGARFELRGPRRIDEVARLPAWGETWSRRNGVWEIWPKEIGDAEKGIVTDDTACRLTMLHPWLLAASSPELTEPGFRRWLEAAPEPKFDWGGFWRRMRHQWGVMWEDQARWAQILAEDSMADPADFEVSGENPFYRPGEPVVFGLFLFLEAAFVCPVETALDEGIAGEASAFWSAALAAAVDQSEGAFGDFLAERARCDPGSELEPHLVEALELGAQLRAAGKSEDEVVEALNELFENFPDTPPKSYHPLLFTKLMAVAAAFARDDARVALRILAACPGDSDTMPSMLGSVWGAFSGPQAIGEDWSVPVTAFVKRRFGVDLSELASALVRRRLDARGRP